VRRGITLDEAARRNARGDGSRCTESELSFFNAALREALLFPVKEDVPSLRELSLREHGGGFDLLSTSARERLSTCAERGVAAGCETIARLKGEGAANAALEAFGEKRWNKAKLSLLRREKWAASFADSLSETFRSAAMFAGEKYRRYAGKMVGNGRKIAEMVVLAGFLSLAAANADAAMVPVRAEYSALPKMTVSARAEAVSFGETVCRNVAAVARAHAEKEFVSAVKSAHEDGTGTTGVARILEKAERLAEFSSRPTVFLAAALRASGVSDGKTERVFSDFGLDEREVERTVETEGVLSEIAEKYRREAPVSNPFVGMGL